MADYPEDVERRLLCRLRSGVWSRSLPGEPALARDLACSRHALRRVLLRLQEQGLLAARPRQGWSIVQRPSQAAVHVVMVARNESGEFAPLVPGLRHAAEHCQQAIVFHTVKSQHEDLLRAVLEQAAASASALIIQQHLLRDHAWLGPWCRDFGRPVVLLQNYDDEDDGFDRVGMDYEATGERAAEALLEQGYDNVVHVTYSRVPIFSAVTRGFCQAMRRAGCEPRVVDMQQRLWMGEAERRELAQDIWQAGADGGIRVIHTAMQHINMTLIPLLAASEKKLGRDVLVCRQHRGFGPSQMPWEVRVPVENQYAVGYAAMLQVLQRLHGDRQAPVCRRMQPVFPKALKISEHERWQPMPAPPVVTGMVRDLVLHRFPEGRCLPGERPLAEHYGLSRGTIRLVLQRLQGDGWVCPRWGKGWFPQWPERSGWILMLRDARQMAAAGQERAEGLLRQCGWHVLSLAWAERPDPSAIDRGFAGMLVPRLMSGVHLPQVVMPAGKRCDGAILELLMQLACRGRIAGRAEPD